MEGLGLENEERVEYNKYFGDFDIIKINPKRFPPYLADLPDPKLGDPMFMGMEESSGELIKYFLVYAHKNIH